MNYQNTQEKEEIPYQTGIVAMILSSHPRGTYFDTLEAQLVSLIRKEQKNNSKIIEENFEVMAGSYSPQINKAINYLIETNSIIFSKKMSRTNSPIYFLKKDLSNKFSDEEKKYFESLGKNLCRSRV